MINCNKVIKSPVLHWLVKYCAQYSPDWAQAHELFINKSTKTISDLKKKKKKRICLARQMTWPPNYAVWFVQVFNICQLTPPLAFSESKSNAYDYEKIRVTTYLAGCLTVLALFEKLIHLQRMFQVYLPFMTIFSVKYESYTCRYGSDSIKYSPVSTAASSISSLPLWRSAQNCSPMTRTCTNKLTSHNTSYKV